MNRLDLTIVNKVSELEKIAAVVDDLSDRWSLPPKTALQLNLVLEELVTNVMFHGHTDGLEHDIQIEFTRGEGNTISVVVSDDAPEFNLVDQPDDARVDKSLDERKIGGLGIHFVKTVMDRVEYARRGGKNVVTVTKKY
jgi:serine/threonine-protein kinase RsbW